MDAALQHSKCSHISIWAILEMIVTVDMHIIGLTISCLIGLIYAKIMHLFSLLIYRTCNAEDDLFPFPVADSIT